MPTDPELPDDLSPVPPTVLIKEIPTEDGKTRPADLVETILGPTESRIRFNFHPGQRRAWDSERRFIAVVAGAQSGKTVFGPVWLMREIQMKGRGDYLVVTPTFTLLELKALPAFKKLFETQMKLGTYVGHPVRKFTYSKDGEERTFGSHDPENPTTIYFAYAEDPESLESMTVKAAWLDEAGQRKFKLGSWEAIQRRLSIHEGRALITTTPYDFGWLKKEIFDRFMAGNELYDVIQFNSAENPAFSQKEFDRAKSTMPAWKFALFYEDRFMRPAGMIYDCFTEKENTCKRFEIPRHWERYVGLDFGGANTAAIFLAAKPFTSKLYLYRIYLAGGRTAVEHCYYITQGEPAIETCVGGSRAEGQWRQEFRAGGKIHLPMGQTIEVQGMMVKRPLIVEVTVGIDRMYGAIKRGELVIFDDLKPFIDQLEEYSWVIDGAGNPTGDIEDKATFHLLDGARYVLSYIRGPLFNDEIPEEPAAKAERIKSELETARIQAIEDEKTRQRTADEEDYKAQHNIHDPRWWPGGFGS